MAFTHKVNTSYSTDEGPVVSSFDTQTGNTEVGFDGTIAATTDNIEVDIGFAHTPTKALEFWSSTALTVKTNSSSSPTQTISLTANQALIWTVAHPESNPITADVTKLFLSNDTSGIATVKIRVLVT